MERKVILYLAMSLDGFIADKNGGVGWIDVYKRQGTPAANKPFPRAPCAWC